jgi:hypothetical protein
MFHNTQDDGGPGDTGNLSVSKVVIDENVWVDQSTTFDICITGPSYPTENCQTIGLDGGVLDWTGLIPGDYTVTEIVPDSTWEVTGVPITVTVNANQTTTVEVVNRARAGGVDRPVLECPAGYDQIDIVSHSALLTQVINQQYNGEFWVAEPTDGLLIVQSMVGHPEAGCPASGSSLCDNQDGESFFIDIAGQTFFATTSGKNSSST